MDAHIDADRHLPLRCHLINLGGCAITYGQNNGCQLFNEPTLAVDDDDLYLRAPNGASGETLISGPLLGALRTVREVERPADAVENLPDDKPALALLDGTLAFWDLQRGNPRYVADVLIAERLQPALARLRAASTNRRPVAVAAYTSRPRTTEAAGAARLMLCDQGDGDCNRLCTARRSDLASCDGAAGFDDRELFELLLEPGHRSPLYRSSHLAARFALGLATGQEWSHFYYLNGGAEIAPVKEPDPHCTSAPGWCSASARPFPWRETRMPLAARSATLPVLRAVLIAGNESGRGSVAHRADHVTLPSMVQRDQRNHFPPPALTGLAPLGSQRVRCPSHPSVHNTYYAIRQ